MIKKTLLFSLCAVFAVGGEYFYIHKGKRVELTPLPDGSVRLRGSAAPLAFKTAKGTEILIPNRLVVKIAPEASIDAILANTDVQILRKYRDGLYLLKTRSPKAALDVANALSLNPSVIYAQPDIMQRWRLR
ncbi:S8 family serine peptidase [Hydrogenimonas urashimensis]|uniref:S8 family serine peptidase n=1 Tax=Hydrogenimonas urashimensis TaxID=2740515 RepID=UPI0019158DA4|nr:hypothetical protein [Hydrogenimonas urashimensis]